jgi:hypothetical protein
VANVPVEAFAAGVTSGEEAPRAIALVQFFQRLGSGKNIVLRKV